MENIIAAHNLVFHYPQDPRIALDDLSLEVKRGELVAVLGHNGSGKSTFAKHINAVLLPEGGVCYVDGIDTKDESRLLELRSKAGMVFQNPDNQIVATIVEEDVAFGLENIGVPPAEIRERVDRALKDVGMYDYRLHAPHQLSGGQKQRVAIAGIIAMRPNIIILDEPTAMLDPKGRREVLDTIIRLNRDFGVTVLLITHYMDEAAKCDRVVVVEQGKVLLDAPPKQVFSHVNVLREVGLDVPQATELVFELRKHAVNLPSDIIDIDECAQAIAEYVKAKGITDIPVPHKQAISAPLQRGIALEALNLSYVYSPGTPFEKVAVEDFNIQIEKGDFVGVIGHTGSGKSTFIQHLNGLLRPTGGRVLLNGKDIWKEPKAIRKVRFQVGLVFQYPEYQLFEETVARDIAFGPTNMGLSQQEIDSRVAEAAEYVGLPEDVMERSPFELSGGQKRRVAIAGVLAMRPDVLILDEPTAGLDPKGREQIFHEINQYHKNTGSTVLLVSHSMEDIAKVANRVIVINDSKIFAYGTVDEVFSRTRELQEMGLSVPQISQIFLKLRELGVPVSEHVYTIEAARDDLLRILGKGGSADA